MFADTFFYVLLYVWTSQYIHLWQKLLTLQLKKKKNHKVKNQFLAGELQVWVPPGLSPNQRPLPDRWIAYVVEVSG